MKMLKKSLNCLMEKKSKFRDVVILNSASALVATGNAQDLQEGALKSIESLDNGKALEKLEMLIKMTNLKDWNENDNKTSRNHKL